MSKQPVVVFTVQVDSEPDTCGAYNPVVGRFCQKAHGHRGGHVWPGYNDGEGSHEGDRRPVDH